MYNYSYIYDYYPESVKNVTPAQQKDRDRVQDFMMGEPSEELITKVLSKVLELSGSEKVTLVCFAPGTTGSKTVLRFSELASRLSDVLDCGVYLDAVTLRFDSDPITHTRYYQCNKDRIKGQDVLLLGSVYTTGQSLQEVGDLIMQTGARSLRALFVAKTVCE